MQILEQKWYLRKTCTPVTSYWTVSHCFTLWKLCVIVNVLFFFISCMQGLSLPQLHIVVLYCSVSHLLSIFIYFTRLY